MFGPTAVMADVSGSWKAGFEMVRELYRCRIEAPSDDEILLRVRESSSAGCVDDAERLRDGLTHLLPMNLLCEVAGTSVRQHRDL